MKRHVSIAALFVIGILATATGCAQPHAAPEAKEEKLLLKVLEKIGPFPSSSPLSAEEEATELKRTADMYWDNVTSVFPNATRPVVSAEMTVTSGARETALAGCLTELGVALSDPENASLWQPATEAEFLSWYTCHVRFPEPPTAAPSIEQLGYLYDYLTMFMVPCLEGRGSTIAKPPSRSVFVDTWPEQGWYPTPTNADPGSPESEATFAACPALRRH